MNKVRPYSGIIPPLVTPLSAPDTLDVPGFERLVEHVIAGGVHGIFILGTTGEGPSLGYQLRREVIERACRHARGRVPTLVGITDTSFTESLNLARHAADCGAQAVVFSAPFYFSISQTELGDYIEKMAHASPLPIFLYNIPRLTKTPFEPETIRRVANIGKIIGIKDSSRDFDYFQRVIDVAKARPDWSLLVGTDALLPEVIKLGGHGGVSGGANIHPRLLVNLYLAAAGGDHARATELQSEVKSLGRLYNVVNHATAGIKGTKCALSLLGICNDLMAEPFSRFDEPERQAIRAILQEIGLSANAA